MGYSGIFNMMNLNTSISFCHSIKVLGNFCFTSIIYNYYFKIRICLLKNTVKASF